MRTQAIRKQAAVAFIAWLLLFTPAFAQRALQLPVDFMIENGNFSQTLVTVKKDGATVYTMPGKNFMKVKLEFNNDYILSFSKPGYITKSIAVNTEVPPERLAQSFEPYKIGVKLFRQYEGVNIVVYNQPVARIHFNPSIDDFDYDVDYTKSILSILRKTEEELMLKAAEERASSTGTYQVQNEESESEENLSGSQSGQMSEHVTTSSDPVTIQRQAAIPEPPVSDAALQKANAEGDDKKAPPSSGSGDDKKAPPSSAGNDDAREKNAPEAGHDPGMANVVKGGDDKPAVSYISSLGDDLRNSGQHDEGFDLPAESNAIAEEFSTKKFILVEQNRTITTFTVIKGLSIAEYRKVDYNWGGVFYFKDGDYAISRSIFHWATGEF